MVRTRLWRAGSMCVGVALVAFGQSAVHDAGPRSEPPGLVGSWLLNEKESEDPRLKFSRHREGRPGEADTAVETRPGPGGWPRPGGPAASPRPAEPQKRVVTGPREFLESPRTLTIAAAGRELMLEFTFAGTDTRTVRLLVDGTEQKESGVTRVARWEGSSLVVDSTPDAGGRLSARYNPLPGHRLEVYSRYVDKDGALMTLRRVFDAAGARESPPKPPSAEARRPETEDDPQSGTGQVPPRASPPGAAQDAPSFGVTTELVYVRFHIDKKGGPVDRLDKHQIRVLEDGRPQTIALLETPSTRERSVPPEVVLALDVSSSVLDAGLLDESLVRDAFFAGLSEETTVGLCAFGGALRCLVPPTRDVRALLAGFEEAMLFGRQTRNEGTRLYDSVVEICRKASEGGKAQRGLVIFSDGLDNRGGEVGDAVRAAADTDMRVYAVKLSQAFRDAAANLRSGGFGRTPNRALYDYKKFDLDRLASETGGRSYEPGTLDKKSMTAILQSIATEIRTEYIVGYPPDGAATGRKRRVKVELADKSLGSIRGGERTLVR